MIVRTDDLSRRDLKLLRVNCENWKSANKVNDRYYQILGVHAGASAAELKSAFRRLAHRYHPDISTDANAKEKFIEVVDAYRALTSEKSAHALFQAKEWEVQTKKWEAFKPKQTQSTRSKKTEQKKETNSLQEDISNKKTTSEQENETLKDKSENEFKSPKKGKDCNMEVLLSVEELYWGVEVKVDPVSGCHGRRSEKGWRNSSMLKVKVKRGTHNGARLRVGGKGEPGVDGGPSGDLVLTIKLKPHDRYEVSGENIYVDMPISRWEAKEGAIIDLMTPGGRVEVDVPNGISSGQSIRIPKRGLPHSSSSPGDMFAVARLVGAEERTDNLYKWPHVPHNGAVRWQTVGKTHGSNIDVRV